MESIILGILSFLAKLILTIHRPLIIGVTGTVGKTTISSHIASYLSYQFHGDAVMYSKFHYNGEYGLPLTVIGAKTGGKNPFLWCWVICIAIYRLFSSYPKFLVLEYGIDHPGEMDFLLNITIPDVAIITEIVPNHIQQFGNFLAYRNEKLKICTGPKLLIAHESLRQYIDRECILYGRGAMADIDASDVSVNEKGTHAIVHAYNKDFPIFLSVFGEFQIDNLLPIYPLAHFLGERLEVIGEYAKKFRPESGRSGILKGIENSVIIDGSYNAGYLSMHSGLISMRSFLHSHSIIFLLGDMRELGEEEASLHTQLADDILKIFPDDAHIEFVFVGPLMKRYIVPLIRDTFPVTHFYSSQEAGKYIGSILSTKDIQTMVYIKGSQNTIFLEEGIKYFLASSKDEALLCRQSSDWKDKKSRFFASLDHE